MEILKIGKYLIAGMLLSSNLLAGEVHSPNKATMYIGVGSIIGSGEETIEYNGETSKYSYDGSGGNLKMGVITNNFNRFEISYNVFNIEGNGWSDTYYGIDFDYLWVFSTKSNLNPYLGLGLAYCVSENMTGYNENGEEENAQALGFNLSAGFIYEIGDSFELECAYKITGVEWNYVDIDVSDDISNFYIGGNLKF